MNVAYCIAFYLIISRDYQINSTNEGPSHPLCQFKLDALYPSFVISSILELSFCKMFVPFCAVTLNYCVVQQI